MSSCCQDADLDEAITKNYYTVASTGTNTLDLSGAFIGRDIIKVLAHIKKSAFYNHIEHLILSRNHFENAFNSESQELPEWPPNLRILDLSQNQLSGSYFPWKQLPENLETLYLQSNDLKGSVDWNGLPMELKTLWIFGNQFEGTIAWDELPANLNSLGVSYKMGDDSEMDELWIKDPKLRSDRVKTFYTKSGPKPAPYNTFNSFKSKADSPSDSEPDKAYRMKLGLFLLSVVIMMAPAIIYTLLYHPSRIFNMTGPNGGKPY